jgi:hypothetical protein
MLLLCCTFIYIWISEYGFIIFILIYIFIFLVLCCYIYCLHSCEVSNILTVLLSVILSHIHIPLMFCHYISCIYSYRLWNILIVLLTVILSHIHISPMLCHYIPCTYSTQFEIYLLFPKLKYSHTFFLILTWKLFKMQKFSTLNSNAQHKLQSQAAL